MRVDSWCDDQESVLVTVISVRGKYREVPRRLALLESFIFICYIDDYLLTYGAEPFLKSH
jgi:hypothetical protein